MEPKLGKTLYSIAFYEKVKRAVIPIGKDGDFILVVSFDNEADPDPIIRNKIMPLYLIPSNIAKSCYYRSSSSCEDLQSLMAVNVSSRRLLD